MRLLLPILLALTLPAGASADLTDLSASLADRQGRVFIAFDSQPTAVSIEQTASGARLHIHGVSVTQRRISPAHADLVLAVDVMPAENGAWIDLTASGLWTAVDAQLVRGGIYLTVDVDAASYAPTIAPELAPEQAAARVPAAEPVAETTAGPVIARAEAAAPARPSQPQSARQEQAVADQPAETAASIAPDLCDAAAQAVAADPWNDAALVRHAQCLRDAGDVVAAAGIYEQMLAFEPENAAIAYALAEIQEETGDIEGAARRYRQAAAHARSDAAAAAAINRARALERQ